MSVPAPPPPAEETLATEDTRRVVFRPKSAAELVGCSAAAAAALEEEAAEAGQAAEAFNLLEGEQRQLGQVGGGALGQLAQLKREEEIIYENPGNEAIRVSFFSYFILLFLSRRIILL